jgi:hypothetical protein
MPRQLRPSRLVWDYYHSVAHVDPLTSQVVNSLLTLRLNDANQITRHTEEWDHDREMTTDDGFLGMLKEHRKRTALIDV